METIIADKEQALKLINEDSLRLYNCSMDLRDDWDVVIAAVKNHGVVISYASQRLCDDKEIALVAIKDNPHALKYLSARLRADKQVVLEAVKLNPATLNHASDDIQELCRNKDPVTILQAAILEEKLCASLEEKPATMRRPKV